MRLRLAGEGWGPLTLALWIAGWGAVGACAGGSPTSEAPASLQQVPAPAPAAEPVACEPELTLAPPSREVRSPAAVPLSPELKQTRDILVGVLEAHTRDPANPWAIGHGMLALGPELQLSNGRSAVDWLFEAYATVEGAGLSFPPSRGDIRIEPHKDLVLKALTEVGVPPDRTVEVADQTFTVADLYRQSLCTAWTDDGSISYGSWDDSPWALQGLASWAPAELTWQTAGHDMTMDALTGAVVERLRKETAFMRAAMERGQRVEKRRQGIFGYTCGGAHLLQGAAHAVARGFGTEAHRRHLAQEVDVLFWRLDLELDIVDQALSQHPEYGLMLVGQRLKFLGHFLESAHKLAASGLYEPSDAQTRALDRALAELIKTVGMLEKAGVLARLSEIRESNEQLYLDYVGDAAHAVRGIDLATGVGVVRL